MQSVRFVLFACAIAGITGCGSRFTISDCILSSADTELFEAVRNNDVKAAMAAINSGASVNIWEQDQFGFHRTPLLISIENNYLDMVVFLLGKGANVDRRTEFIPVFHALKYGNDALVTIIMDQNPSLRIINIAGEMPIHWAAYYGRTAFIRSLSHLDHAGIHAKVRGKINRSWQPLHFAALNGHFETVRELLALGADADAYASHFFFRSFRKTNDKFEIPISATEGVMRVWEIPGAQNWRVFPVQLAFINGHASLVELLKEHTTSPQAELPGSEWKPPVYPVHEYPLNKTTNDLSE